jgi:hypothetical protein
MKKKLVLEFTEPMLGTLTGNKEAATEFILGKRPEGIAMDEAENLAAMNESLVKGTTYFPADGKGSFLWDYQVKGFIKEAARSLAMTDQYDKDGLKKLGLSSFGPTMSKKLDALVFVNPRKIYLDIPRGLAMGFLERPLRAQTMQGERIALARSQMAPAGTKIEIEVVTLNAAIDAFIMDCFEYGALRGIGQWRNSSAGRFIYREVA